MEMNYCLHGMVPKLRKGLPWSAFINVATFSTTEEVSSIFYGFTTPKVSLTDPTLMTVSLDNVSIGMASFSHVWHQLLRRAVRNASFELLMPFSE
jgi:hypothetical protein